MTTDAKARLDEAKARVAKHIVDAGGPWEVGEADSVLNDGNRAILDTFHAAHGACWLGRINFYGEERARLQSGEIRPLTEWAPGRFVVLNFSCDFAIPVEDADLARLIVDRDAAPWVAADDAKRIDAILSRVLALGGVLFQWT